MRMRTGGLRFRDCGPLMASVGILLVALGLGVARGDIDVASPSGRPLEWERNLLRPVPTERGIVPQRVPLEPDRMVTPAPSNMPPDNSNRSQVMQPPPTIKAPLRMALRPVVNLYGYFNVTTPDLPGHVELVPVTPEGNPKPPKVITVGSPDELEIKYPPEHPPELVWDALCSILRVTLHPETNPETESLIHAITLGDPASRGADIVRREPQATVVARHVGVLPPSAPAVPQFQGTPLEQMLLRVAVIELSNGYAYALDPKFGQRTLAAGNEVVPGLIACANSSHPLLRRNATALLGHFPATLTGEALRALTRHSDIVVRLRAIKALAEQRDTRHIKTLLTLLDTGGEMEQILALQGLGLLDDAAVLPELKRRADYAWSRPELLGPWLVAVIRVGGDDPALRTRIKSMATELFGRIPNPQGQVFSRSNYGTPMFGEPYGFRNRLLWELTQFALAACGDREAATRILLMKLSEVHSSNWLHWCEAIEQVGGNEGVVALRTIIDQCQDLLVKIHALNVAYNISADPLWLQRLAMTGCNFLVRAQALVLLGQISPGLAKSTCAAILRVLPLPAVEVDGSQQNLRGQAKLNEWVTQMARAGQPGNLAPNPSEMAYATAESAAHFIQVLIAVGSQLGAFKFHDLQPWVRSLFYCQFHARRIGTVNVEEIPKVSLFPPAMETAIYEFGRGADIRALPLLIEILESKRAVGPCEAALALGNLPCRPAAAALINALAGADGWKRFCAYRALKTLSGKDYLCDWIFGSNSDRAAATQKYAQWLKETYPE